MKPLTSLALLWKVKFARNMPQEVFGLLKLTILKGNYGIVVSSIKLTAVTTWILYAINKTNSAVQEKDILCKPMKDASRCGAVISPDHPLILSYSKAKEKITIALR